MPLAINGAYTINAIASHTIHTLDAPSSIVEGELLIAQHRHGQGANVWTDLGGWTELHKNVRHTVAGKIATSGDVALAGTADAWTWTGDSSGIGIVAVFRVSSQEALALDDFGG